MKKLPILLAVIIMACGQEKPVAESDIPTRIDVDFTGQAVQFPPAVADDTDRTEWKERSYGEAPILLQSPVNLPNTGDRTPESAKAYVAKNDTWAASLYSEVQTVLNYISYRPEVNIQLQAIADFAVREMAAEEGVSGQQSRASELLVPGADKAIRIDGIQYHDGILNYWALITLRKGQDIWQLTAIYPEDYRQGPGDVEYLIRSLRIP
jgi:hypothetical protein